MTIFAQTGTVLESELSPKDPSRPRLSRARQHRETRTQNGRRTLTKLEQFFARYEEGANTFDPDLVTSQYTLCFAGGDPNQVVCLQNDDAFRKAIVERAEVFRQIGFRSAKVLGVAETPLDEHYTMAKVHWHMVFEKEAGKPLDFKFYITYFVFDSGEGPKVAFDISHEDEQKVMRDAGLRP